MASVHLVIRITRTWQTAQKSAFHSDESSCDLRTKGRYLKSFDASIEFGCTGIELPYRLRKIRLSRPAHRIRRFAEANAGSNGSHRGVAETTQDASTTCLQG